MHAMRRLMPPPVLAVATALAVMPAQTTTAAGARFAVTFPASRCADALDGRILLLLSTDEKAEPRFQIGDGPDTQQVFGIDVDALRPGSTAIVDAVAFGYPLRTLADVPSGEYVVQAVLHRSETFHRSDGRTLKLPMDRGEGQHWNVAPGNLYSTPKRVRVEPRGDATIEVVLDQEIPPIVPPKDTKYVRHVRIQSDLLTKFWGRPMHLGA